jgi:hypothetical protein
MYDHLHTSRGWEPVEIEHGYMWTADPRWRELRSESNDDKDAQRRNSLDEQVKRLPRGRIAPVYVFPHDQHRFMRRQPLDLRQLDVKCLLLALLRREIEGWIAVAGRD